MAIVRSLLIASLVIIGGCANTVWVRPGATQDDFAADRSRCDYEAELATPDSYNPRGDLGDAIASGIADGMRKATLMHKCMVAHGWRLQEVQPNNQTPAMAANSSNWMVGYNAYKAGASLDCNSPPPQEGNPTDWTKGCMAAARVYGQSK